jgi:hypothetical protein
VEIGFFPKFLMKPMYRQHTGSQFHRHSLVEGELKYSDSRASFFVYLCLETIFVKLFTDCGSLHESFVCSLAVAIFRMCSLLSENYERKDFSANEEINKEGSAR